MKLEQAVLPLISLTVSGQFSVKLQIYVSLRDNVIFFFLCETNHIQMEGLREMKRQEKKKYDDTLTFPPKPSCNIRDINLSFSCFPS